VHRPIIGLRGHRGNFNWKTILFPYAQRWNGQSVSVPEIFSVVDV
jgi:hypothetical protein